MNEPVKILIFAAVSHLLISIILFVSVMGHAERGDWTYQFSKPRVFFNCLLWPIWMFKQ